MNIGEVLLDRKLLLIGNFILTSGKNSPYYLDLRRFPNYPEFNEIVNLAIQKVKDIKNDMIIGIATGGIPLASFIACKLNKPMGYVRLEKKGYGTDKLVEADVKDKNILIVDDVATTGGSIEKAVEEIRKYGGIVENAFVIIDRNEGARERLNKIGVKLNYIYSINDILKDILDKLGENEKKLIQDYLVKNIE
ncbi:orotate phosphoribosyltransferase [Acidianus sulfidivorans JP7]|uniref:Orotate phosphoribosyltransferase n=1 Tax=Acidianus sulfidivorans JP7 TaxID=619593 RepID=A0A2U9INH8_9CREN|nr:orotate phosphoribosyltransferase [Acidianus sulfidivorans]AWR97570.1 orotate phosphoribosyltransferase [Acidianus sulfidivorans JP7]